MASLTNITVQWNDGRVEIQVRDDFTIRELKDAIYKQTGVKPTDQILHNLTAHAELVDSNTTLKQLNIKNQFVLIMTTAEIPAIASTSSSTSETLCTPTELNVTLDYYSTGTLPYKIPAMPRKHKKLLVLDIDFTIYDCTPRGSAAGEKSMRPHMYHFLKMVHRDFDVAIWSQTSIDIVMSKLNQMDFVNKRRDFKIFLCVGSAKVPTSAINKIKPLHVIWTRYPQFNAQNTVIVDDTETNFACNPKNGILVTPYYYQNYGTDQELLLLVQYFKRLAKLPDVTSLDHSHWRESVVTL